LLLTCRYFSKPLKVLLAMLAFQSSAGDHDATDKCLQIELKGVGKKGVAETKSERAILGTFENAGAGTI